MMPDAQVEIEINNETDIINARCEIRKLIIDCLDLTSLARLQVITAVSELARNIYMYAGQWKNNRECRSLQPWKKRNKNCFCRQRPGNQEC